jgi:predicted nucleic acid-binding protein
MICLDTNYLIRGVAIGTTEADDLVRWFGQGKILITPMPAWFEFICGPVTADQIRTMRAFLTRIIPFGEEEAEEAARLFNAGKRKRSLRVDAMIAATSIISGARLANKNRSDFEPFVAHGLNLVP